MSKLFIIIGAINAMLVVILGAFGAHGLKAKLSFEMMAVYQTGVQYHFYHAIGLILIGVIAFHLPASAFLKWSGWIMLVGIILFSGSLYILALNKTLWLGVITPIGGIAFIVSWLLLVIAALDIK